MYTFLRVHDLGSEMFCKFAVGMLEKALFYTEYKNVNHTGEECE